jgi:hypothetical protein
VQNRRDVVAATLPGGSLFGKPGHHPVVDYNPKVRLELAILLGAGREETYRFIQDCCQAALALVRYQDAIFLNRKISIMGIDILP